MSLEGFTATDHIIKWLSNLDGQKLFVALINENQIQKQGDRALEELRFKLR